MYKKIMGLDVGDKRIGIAMSDPLRITAQGIESYTRKTLAEDIAHIGGILRENGGDTIVCGLPKNMNGTIGPQAEKIIVFAHELEQGIGAEIILYDERLTTVIAEKALIEADVSRKKRRKVVDMLAAVTILQGYLDQNKF